MVVADGGGVGVGGGAGDGDEVVVVVVVVVVGWVRILVLLTPRHHTVMSTKLRTNKRLRMTD